MNFLRDNTVALFFVGIFVLTLLALFSFKPQGEVFADVDNVDIAKIDMKNFTLHQMKKDIIDTLIVGREATQFRDYETFKEISVSRSLENDEFETIVGQFVHRKDNIYSFYNGVDYRRSDGLGFYSQSGVFNAPRELFTGKGDFTLENTQGIIKGKNIVYDKKNAMIFAKHIRSKINIDKN